MLPLPQELNHTDERTSSEEGRWQVGSSGIHKSRESSDQEKPMTMTTSPTFGQQQQQ